jgi:dTDP-4-amino-4,6-dideoxygalactose transaminase
MNNRLYLSPPHMGGREQVYVQQAFEANWISPAGPNLQGFESDIAKYLGQNVSVAALSSGTAAIHLALIILGVKAGDEVICSSFTFSGSCNPIVYQGATPVFVDSEEETWNMDPVLLKSAIEDRMAMTGRKPKAIIMVHLYGMPAKIDEIIKIAQQYEIPVIEDAAEALGSTFKGQKCGTFGDFGILSFNGNKIITTSGGGALVAKNQQWIEKARFLATQARDQAPHYQHSEIGYNYRLSNICAGIGRGQMEVIDERVRQRRQVFEWYSKYLPSDKFILTEAPLDFYSNRWLTTALILENRSPEQARIALEQHNVESRPLWKAMHLQPVFSEFPHYGNGTSEKLFSKGICLPSGSAMTEEDVKKVVALLSS